MLNNLILLTAVEAANETSGFDYGKLFRFGALIVVLGIMIYFVMKNPSTKEKEATNKFLNDMTDTVFKIVMANVEIEKQDDKIKFHLKDYNEFKHLIAAEVYDDAWEYATTVIDTMVEEGKMSPMVKKLVTKDRVEAVVDTVMDSSDCKTDLASIYKTITKDLGITENNAEETIKQIEEEEKKAAEEAAKYEAEPQDIIEGVNDKIVSDGEPVGTDMTEPDPETEEVVEEITSDPTTEVKENETLNIDATGNNDGFPEG